MARRKSSCRSGPVWSDSALAPSANAGVALHSLDATNLIQLPSGALANARLNGNLPRLGSRKRFRDEPVCAQRSGWSLISQLDGRARCPPCRALRGRSPKARKSLDANASRPHRPVSQ